MDILSAFAVVVEAALCMTIAAWIISWYRQRKLVQQATQWAPIEATIESGALEGTRETGKVVLPTFAFSYQVSGESYTGRFSLRANVSRKSAESMIDQMIGRRIFLRHDPDNPERWFIPDEHIEGYKVEQKIGPHLIHDYAPND